MNSKINIKILANHLKSTGFVFGGSEIYDGFNNTYDYGPLGVMLMNNIKKMWLKHFIYDDENYLINANMFLSNRVWKASGHIKKFHDLMIICLNCSKKYKVSDYCEKNNITLEAFNKKHLEKKIICDKCTQNKFSDIIPFDLMFKTNIGFLSTNNKHVYLRPELAQGIYINFFNTQKATKKALPFGIGQIGKSYRNEITTNHFIFKIREFEQLELQFFIYPSENERKKWFQFYRDKIETFLTHTLKLNKKNIKIIDINKSDLAHYSDKTIDFMYKFLFGFGELWGLSDRGNIDLTNHIKESKKNLFYLDPKTHEKIVPYVIEPSVGLDRLLLSIIIENFDIETLGNNTERVIIHFPINLAPYKVAILPLSKEQNNNAKNVYNVLRQKYSIIYDEKGSIGKRYRRQDSIGTPFCITFDKETASNKSVTIRYRDTMKQIRIQINNIEKFIKKEILLND